LASNAGDSGVLKMKMKPKMLQPWQAYQALTYEEKWKPQIDKVWESYKEDWARENPGEKLPKTRFQIMVEFIKEKFANESEEMKQRCEVYRKENKGSPGPADTESDRNLMY